LFFKTKKLTFKKFILLSVAASSLFSYLYFNNFYPREYYDKIVTLDAVVTEKDFSYNGAPIYTLKSKFIDGEKDSHKIYWYDYDTNNLSVGDRIVIEAKIQAFEETDSYERNSYYIGCGYSCSIWAKSTPQLHSKNNYVENKLFADIRDNISKIFIERTNKETGGLLSALILGERDNLDPTFYLNFQRIGITHILALSGMHLAILCGLLSFILGIFGVGKRTKSCFTIIFCTLYMLLCGMPSSVVRASFMLIINATLFLIAKMKDSFTSLCIAVLILVLIEPYAVFDLSLWLSAFATLGIVSFSEYKQKRSVDKVVRKGISSITDLISASMFAIGATFLFTLTNFTYFSALSVVSTLIFSPIIELFIYAGIFELVFGKLFSLGEALEYLAHGIKHLSELFSDNKWCTILIDIPITILVSIFIILFFSFILFKIKRKKLYVASLFLLFISILTAGSVISNAQYKKDEVLFCPTESGDLIITVDKNQASLIYTGDYSIDTAYNTLSYFTSYRYNYIDNLILTSYNDKIDKFVDVVDNEIKCKTVYLPIPNNDLELKLAEQIAICTSTSGSQVKFYSENEPISLGYSFFHLVSRNTFSGDIYTPKTVYLFGRDENLYTYITKEMLEGDYNSVSDVLYNSKALIIGSFGKGFSAEFKFHFQIDGLDLILLPNDLKLTDLAKDFYNNKGARVESTGAPTSIKR
jgi:ComEC/Rec2-related protein